MWTFLLTAYFLVALIHSNCTKTLAHEVLQMPICIWPCMLRELTIISIKETYYGPQPDMCITYNFEAYSSRCYIVVLLTNESNPVCTNTPHCISIKMLSELFLLLTKACKQIALNSLIESFSMENQNVCLVHEIKMLPCFPLFLILFRWNDNFTITIGRHNYTV